MATIDFTTPVANGGCGCNTPGSASNVAAAMAQWRVFVSNPAHWPPTLTIAAGTYNGTTDAFFTDFTGIANGDSAGINPTITGTGGTAIFNIDPFGATSSAFGRPLWGSAPNPNDPISSLGSLQPVSKGSTTVTLKTASDANKFSVGRWVVIGGLELQGQGWPPNWQFYEFHTVTNISGAVVTLDSPLRFSYSDHWPAPVPLAQGRRWDGPGVMMLMDTYWDNKHTFNNIQWSANGAVGQTCFGVRNLELNNCIWTDNGPSLSWCKDILLNACVSTGSQANGSDGQWEIDKVIDTVTFKNCNGWGPGNTFVIFQSACPVTLIKDNSNGNCAFNGTGQNTRLINGSSEGSLNILGPDFFGRGSTYTVDATSHVTGPYFAAVRGFGGSGFNQPLASFYSYIGSGIIRVPKAGLPDPDDITQNTVPGFQSLVARKAGGVLTLDPDGGGPRKYFCVTDFTEDANFFFIHTDLTAFPTQTFGGQPGNFWLATPFINGGTIGIVNPLPNGIGPYPTEQTATCGNAADATFSTTTGVVSNANPINVGQTATLTATVTPIGSAIVPTGTVQFFDGASLLGTGTLGGAGTTTFAFTSPPGVVGPNSITAVYSGDTNYSGSTSSPLSQTVNGSGGTVPVVSHVYVILLENSDFTDVIGNPAMPYLNSVAQQYGVATQYFANTHPSIGNYFELTVGLIESNDDAFAGTVTDDNIVRHILAAGLTWKCYAESLPSVGYVGGDAGTSILGPGNPLYIKHHNPFAYFSDVLNSQTQKNNIVPLSQLATDANAHTLPRLIWIVPDNNDNLHDGTPAQCDAFLQANIAPLLSASTDDVFIIVVDESSTGQLVSGVTTPPANRVACIIAGPHNKLGFQSTTQYQHPSTLKLCCDLLGISAPNAGATAPSMVEFFTTTIFSTTTGLVSNANPITVGQNATLTATVTPIGGVVVPTGTVQFFDGAASLGTASLNGAAQATFTFATVLHPPGPLGPHSITAVYSGDANYSSSTSPALVEVVSPLTSSFIRASRGSLWRRIVR